MGSRFGRSNVLLVVLALLCLVGYSRDYIYTFKPVTPIHDVNAIYASSVWIHYITDKDTFAGTGWAVAYDEDLGLTYISTAGHVVDHGAGAIAVFYWPGTGGWKITTGFPIHQSSREAGDIAIIAIPVKLPLLSVATHKEYKIDDEVLIAGIQNQAPPALVSFGYIAKITESRVYVDAWSWRGHSGGPLIHRKTKKVIGFVTAFGSEDTAHASFTECSNFKVITTALHDAGIE